MINREAEFGKARIIPAAGFLVGGAMLLLSPVSGAADAFKRVTTSEQFKAAVAGRRLVAGRAYYVIHANGAFSGRSPNGAKVSGTWTWRGQYFCRRGTIGNETLADDCQKAFVSRHRLRLVRNRGRGSTVELRIR